MNADSLLHAGYMFLLHLFSKPFGDGAFALVLHPLHPHLHGITLKGYGSLWAFLSLTSIQDTAIPYHMASSVFHVGSQRLCEGAAAALRGSDAARGSRCTPAALHGAWKA